MFTAVVWTGITLIVAWTIAFFFANLFQCVPIYINWQGEGATEQNCIDETSMYLAQAWSDVWTDSEHAQMVSEQLTNSRKLLFSQSLFQWYVHFPELFMNIRYRILTTFRCGSFTCQRDARSASWVSSCLALCMIPDENCSDPQQADFQSVVAAGATKLAVFNEIAKGTQ